MRLAVFTLALLVTTGCGDDVPVADGSVDGGDGGMSRVALPIIPWLEDGAPPVAPPAFTPCPDGWREVADPDGVTTCDPYPDAGRTDCAAGEAHFPGEAGCRAIGDACPTGDYADSLPASGPIVYVNPAAAPGGDGMLASPHDSLSAIAWSMLAPGTTVALARGSYGGTLPLRAGVAVIGACAAQTVLSGIAAPVQAVVTVTSSGDPARLRNVAIVGAPQGAVHVERSRSLRLEGVRISGAATTAIDVRDSGSEVIAEELVVEDTRGEGRAVFCSGGGRFQGLRLLLIDDADAAVLSIGDGSVAEVTDALIHDTASRPDGTTGVALIAGGGGRIEATRLLATEHYAGAVIAFDRGSLVLTDVVVRDLRGQPSDGRGGIGVLLQDGSTLDAHRLVVKGARYTGISADTGCTATVEDAVIADTTGEPGMDMSGRGVRIVAGGRFEGARIAVLRSSGTGVLTAFGGATIVLTDAIVRRNAVMSDDPFARAMDVQDEARIEAERLVLSDNGQSGLLAIGEGATANLRDVLVSGTVPSIDGIGGHGVAAQEGALLDAERLVIRDVREVGVVANDAAVVLRDALIRHVDGSVAAGRFGMGISAQTGRVTAERVRIEDAREVAILAFTGGTFDGSDVEVSDTRVSASDDPSRAVAASLRLRRFAIRDTATCGLFVSRVNLYPEPVLDVAQGAVEGATIGACVQVEGYDLSLLQNDVLYRGNATNLDVTSLPVPEPLSP